MCVLFNDAIILLMKGAVNERNTCRKHCWYNSDSEIRQYSEKTLSCCQSSILNPTRAGLVSSPGLCIGDWPPEPWHGLQSKMSEYVNFLYKIWKKLRHITIWQTKIIRPLVTNLSPANTGSRILWHIALPAFEAAVTQFRVLAGTARNCALYYALVNMD